MANVSEMTCPRWCWAIAILAGVFAMLVLYRNANLAFMAALIVGVVLAGVLGFLLSNFLCSSVPETRASERRQDEAVGAMSAPVAGVQGEVADVPSVSDAGSGPVPDAPVTAVSEKDGGSAAMAAGLKPLTLDGPREGGADDLKKIKGVGPKLESLLNAMGFWHFDQIAGWSADEVAWVDQNLDGFKGRVSRDGWVAQAKLLADGGETDFSAKVDKGDVY